jgi:hypothetical protein
LAELYNSKADLFNQANVFQFPTNHSIQNVIQSTQAISNNSNNSIQHFNHTPSTSITSATPTTTTTNNTSNSSLNALMAATKRKNSKCAIVRPLNEPRQEINNISTYGKPSQQQQHQQHSLQYPPPNSDEKVIVSNQGLYNPPPFLPVWPMPVYPFTM